MTSDSDSRRNFVKKSIVTTIALSQPTFFSGLVRATGGEGETTGDVTTAPETTWVYETTFPGGGDGGLETTIPFTETLDPGAATTYPPAEYATTVPESTIPVSTITSTTLYHLEAAYDTGTLMGGGYAEEVVGDIRTRRAINYDAKVKLWFNPSSMSDSSEISVEIAVEFYATGGGNPDQAPQTTSAKAIGTCQMKDSSTGEIKLPTVDHAYPTAAADEAGGASTYYASTSSFPGVTHLLFPSWITSAYAPPTGAYSMEYRCRPTIDLVATGSFGSPTGGSTVNNFGQVGLSIKQYYRENVIYRDSSGAILSNSGWVDSPDTISFRVVTFESKL